ncbi:hypothetical protein ACP70R_015509 [Stipagrostis hirtigluma subsp. patula]
MSSDYKFNGPDDLCHPHARTPPARRLLASIPRSHVRFHVKTIRKADRLLPHGKKKNHGTARQFARSGGAVAPDPATAAVGLRFWRVGSVCGLRHARGGAGAGRLQRGGATAPDPATAATGLRLRRIGSVVCFGEFQVPHYLHPLLPRHLKLLCSAAFMAKPALISLIDAASAASTGGSLPWRRAHQRRLGRGPQSHLDLRDAIVKALGFQAEGLKVSRVRLRRAGRACGAGGGVRVRHRGREEGSARAPARGRQPLGLFVDLPIFQSQADADDTAFAEIRRGRRGSVVEPTLPSFQPMELWIQDGHDVRLALPFT